MKQIIEPDERVLKITEKKLDGDIHTRLSRFVYRFDFFDSTVLYNCFTREAVMMDKNDLLCDEYDLNGESDQDIKYLYEHRFFTSDSDEISTYCNTVSLLRIVQRKKGIRTFTILPTTACNAKCFYCFEEGFHPVSMNRQTEDVVIDYILKKNNGKVKIRWFGGEPLLGTGPIRRISAALKKNNIDFVSEIVTNGYLFSESLVREARDDWHLNKASITLDGMKEEYEKRKNYTVSADHFRTVVRNIHFLQETGISVAIRMNADFDNLDNLYQLTDFLNAEFTTKKGLALYAQPLYQVQSTEASIDMWKACMELERYCRSKGFGSRSVTNLKKLGIYYCVAANPSGVVINSDGTLYGCEHCTEQSLLGSIFEYGNDPRVNGTISSSSVSEKCRECPFLPMCTEFRQCPNQVYDCRKLKAMYVEDYFSRYIEK